MAQDFSNIDTTFYTSLFYERIGERVRDWMKVTEFINGTGSAVALQETFGATGYTVQVSQSDPTPDLMDSIENTGSRVTYEKERKVTRADLDDRPDLLRVITLQMADEAQDKLAELYWTKINGAPTDAHPGDQAPYLGGGGGAAFVADTFTAPTAQGNLLTTALSAASLASASASMRAYKGPNKKHAHVDVSPGNLCLVVSPTLLKTAYDLVDMRNQGGGVTESGYSQGMDLVVDPYTLDTNDWYLIAKSHKPVATWLRKAPTMLMERRLGHFEFYVDFDVANLWKPVPDVGFVYNAVA